MFTGQVAVITSTQDWQSQVREIIDDRDETVIDLSDPAYTISIAMTIEELPSDCGQGSTLVTASYSNEGGPDNGKAFIVGEGYGWLLQVADVSSLCVGTYRCRVNVKINGFVQDVVRGTVAVI